eukprot:TRINITY_DN24276_c0_g1_i4.p1 TRINITY_DN24276_c0_g1~~TRINITY_DN24276_c0_g1_i4.p1  ORF type:complete len:259 (-),score=35.68 TRINITY_DN24276_c0_g1_i4:126-902(-)
MRLQDYFCVRCKDTVKAARTALAQRRLFEEEDGDSSPSSKELFEKVREFRDHVVERRLSLIAADSFYHELMVCQWRLDALDAQIEAVEACVSDAAGSTGAAVNGTAASFSEEVAAAGAGGEAPLRLPGGLRAKALDACLAQIGAQEAAAIEAFVRPLACVCVESANVCEIAVPMFRSAPGAAGLTPFMRSLVIPVVLVSVCLQVVRNRNKLVQKCKQMQNRPSLTRAIGPPHMLSSVQARQSAFVVDSSNAASDVETE